MAFNPAGPCFSIMITDAKVKQKAPQRNCCEAQIVWVKSPNEHANPYGLSENRNRLAYVLQNGGKFVVSPGSLHIIVCLQTEPYRCGNPCCSLDF